MYSLTRVLDRFPTCQNAERHQECRQDDEQHRNAVDAHLILQGSEPGVLLDELEAGGGRIEIDQMSSEIANVTSVVQSAIQRALPFASGFSVAISSAPTSGRNVVTERMLLI